MLKSWNETDFRSLRTLLPIYVSASPSYACSSDIALKDQQ